MASSVARRVAQRVLGSNAASAAARAAWSAGQPTPETHPDLLQPGELLPGLAAAEFAARRAALAALLPPGAVALLPAAPITYMAGGAACLLCCSCRALRPPCYVCVSVLPILTAAQRRWALHASMAQHGMSGWEGSLRCCLLACRRRDPVPVSPVCRFSVPYWNHPAICAGSAGLRCAVQVHMGAWGASGIARSVAGGWGRLLRTDLYVERRLAPPLLQPAAHLAYVCTLCAPLCHPSGGVSLIPMPGRIHGSPAAAAKCQVQPTMSDPCTPLPPLRLFVPDPDAWRETWDGARLSADAAAEVFGADEALPLSQVS